MHMLASANSLLFQKKISNKPFVALFRKYCQKLKSTFLYISKKDFVSGGTLFPSTYICIKLPLDIVIYTQCIPIQILWLMHILKLKMRI